MNTFKDCPHCAYIRESLNTNVMMGNTVELAILYHLHVLAKDIDEIKQLNFQTAK